MAKEGEKRLSGTLLGVEGMTPGDVRGLVDLGTGLVGPVRPTRRVTVTKLYQNPIYLAGKGINFERKQIPRKCGTVWEEKR